MGDFNTPPDSVHFKPIRQGFRNAFEIRGNGYSATWPIPLPLLTIDQIWTSHGIRVSRCECAWSWYSDHRPLLAELVIQGRSEDGK